MSDYNDSDNRTIEIPKHGGNYMIRYALSRKSNDRWPIHFKPDCERTLSNPLTGQDESLFDLIQRLDKAGYDLVHTRKELIKKLKERKVYIGE